MIGPNGCLAKMRATRILVTHQVHFLQKADHIVFIDQGQIVEQGTYVELVNSKSNNWLRFIGKTNDEDTRPAEEMVQPQGLADIQLSSEGEQNFGYLKDEAELNVDCKNMVSLNSIYSLYITVNLIC